MDLYSIVLWSMIIVAPVVFCVLFFISAPYGRHDREGWGPAVKSRTGWVIMEAPACLIMLAVLLVADLNLVVVLLLLLWQVHYFHRAFIYPFTLKSQRTMPVVVVLMAIVFNGANGYLNGWHFVRHADWYTSEWLKTPQFIIGLALFAIGYYITKRSDAELRKLREDGFSGYRVPDAFLHRYVAAPNYFGESIQWLGWALMTLSPAAWVFLLWTLANLVPRAISHRNWYRDTFPEYPSERKAMFPYVL